MKIFKILIILSTLFLLSCENTSKNPPVFDPKEKTSPPIGCEDLRKRNPQADC